MITQYLIEKCNGLLRQVPEYRDENQGYTAFNDGSVECEVGEFLYSMVRVLKPRTILETGTYKGVSSAYMGLALKENKVGLLDTMDIEIQHLNTSKQLWGVLDLLPWVKEHHMGSDVFEAKYNYNMMFLDSEPNLRFGELVKFFPNLEPGGYAFIHDCPRTLTQGNINPDHPHLPSWPFGPLPEEIKAWLKSGELVKLHISNPRGMVGFYKRHPEDYQV